MTITTGRRAVELSVFMYYPVFCRFPHNMTQRSAKDKIYAHARSEVQPFRFDEQVAAVFPDMISRSVPGYGAIIDGIAVIASQYAQPRSRCYDLGCSLGAASLAMREGIRVEGCEIIAIDNSSAMLNNAKKLLSNDSDGPRVTLLESDILDVQIENASLVTLNFTLQFIAPEKRAALLKRIYEGLRPGGALVLSEKIRYADPDQDAAFTRLHHEFKRARGYSDLEISQKREALENVLIPETLDAHLHRLDAAGFRLSWPWFQQLNFISLLAVR